MPATFPYVGFLDGQSYPPIGAGSTTVTVTSSAALTTALANASAGQRIVLGNGTYTGAFTISGKAGTSTAPISVEAATTGGAIFASGSTFSITGASAYITLKGLAFPYELSTGNLVQFRGTTHHCRVTRCLFGPTSIGTPGANKSPFIYMGDDTNFIRIDHNELRNKANPGNAILGDGNFTTFQAVQHIRIDHNYIHDIRPEVDNEKEPIRLGVSTMSKTMSYSVIERNVFSGCICEPEIVSVKCGGVRVSGNTVLRSIGGLVYRHGTNGVMNDNYIVDDRYGATTGGGGTTTPPPTTPTQTLGVGGVATPSGAILATSDSTSALTITTSGTATNPRVYDGQGKKIGRVTFDGCQYVVVQNYLIQSGNQYGVVFDDASNVTLQNCDISNVRVSGDGDLNAITVWGGSKNKIRYNTAVNYVSGDPGDSHTDWIQTWVSSSHPNAATNYEIVGNRAIGPANPSRSNSIPSIHQIIMVEGAGRGGNSGGSGNPSGWIVAENEFGDSWNQAIKLDGGTNFIFMRNKFVGSSDKVFDLPSASGVKIYSDNQFGSGYGSNGGTITAGAGPATPV
jgi:hypothetical protein